MARDAQRRKVYNLEDLLFGSKKQELTLAQCQKLSDKARAYYGLEPVPCKAVSDRRYATAHSDYLIKLPPWAHNPATVLHETAHTILVSNRTAFYLPQEECGYQTINDRYGKREVYLIPEYGYSKLQSHGKEFVAVAFDLYHHFLGMNRAKAMEMARERGVEVAPVDGTHRRLAKKVAPVTKPEPKPAADPEDYVSAGTAAKMLHVTRRSVDRYIKAGNLVAFRTFGGHYRVSVESINALLERGAL